MTPNALGLDRGGNRSSTSQYSRHPSDARAYPHDTVWEHLKYIEQMLLRFLCSSGIAPLVPEQFRSLPEPPKVPAASATGVFEPYYFWGHTGDDYFNYVGKNAITSTSVRADEVRKACSPARRKNVFRSPPVWSSEFWENPFE